MAHVLLYVTVKRLFWGRIFTKTMRNFHKRTRTVNKSVHSNENESESLKNLSTTADWCFYKYPFVWFLFISPGISKVTPAIYDSNRGPLRSPDALSLKRDVFSFEAKPPHVELRKSLKRRSGFSSCSRTFNTSKPIQASRLLLSGDNTVCLWLHRVEGICMLADELSHLRGDLCLRYIWANTHSEAWLWALMWPAAVSGNV